MEIQSDSALDSLRDRSPSKRILGLHTAFYPSPSSGDSVFVRWVPGLLGRTVGLGGREVGRERERER